MLRIVQIYKDYDPVVGGIEHHIKALAEGLAARQFDVTVLATSLTRRTEDFVQNGVRVIKAGRAAHIASTPLSLDLLRQARQLQADLVHLHMPYPPGDLVARAIPGAPPLVITYHSDIVRQKRLLSIYRPLLRSTLRRASRIIATSAPYVQSSPFLRRVARKCRIVPLSVDADRFMARHPAAPTIRSKFVQSADDCIILAVGVLRYYKGLHILLDAVARLSATLVIVGQGPEEQRLRDLAQAYGIARRVHFAGRVPDHELPAYYQAADVFALASHLRAEAFGIVQLEALASGLPIISTELGTGTSVVNQHGVTGFVAPPNDPEALARALGVLLANPDLRRHFGDQARRRVVAEYRHAVMIERTIAVYDEALDESVQQHGGT